MIHHVYANRSNIGDWLSARGIQRLLQPLPVVEHLCDECFVPDTLRALRLLTADDFVVIGGGGLFMDYFAPFWEGFRDLRPSLRYVIWGVGYCDLKAEPSHPPLGVVEEVVRRSALCVVRDELTRDHLRGCTLSEPVPCPALNEVDVQPPGRGVLHVDNYTTVGAGAFDVMDAECRRYAKATGRPYRRTNNRIHPDRDGELRDCLARYAQSDVVVSSALHGCVIALAMGRPVLAVSGDRKIEAFMRAASLGDWVLEPGDLAALGSAIEALAGQPPVPDFVGHVRERNRAVAARVRALATCGMSV